MCILMKLVNARKMLNKPKYVEYTLHHVINTFVK